MRPFLAALLLAAGCATTPAKPKGPQVGLLGAEICPATAGIEVEEVLAKSAADSVGLKPGDVIVEANGLDMVKPVNRPRFLQSIRYPNRPLQMKVQRGGQPLDLTVTPTMTPIWVWEPLMDAIYSEVMKGKPVAVALVIDQINYVNSRPGPELDSLKDATKTNLENRVDAILIRSAPRGCGNYHVVDRNKTSEILAELKFQMTGAVSAETVKQIGKLSGASHLVFASYSHWPAGSGYHGVNSIRLVEVESGDVIVADRYEADMPAAGAASKGR